jgi:sugar/nucleoside kinase (ribokinase family)
MARGLFFGLTTVDIFNLVPTHPAANQKVKATRQQFYAGGPAANAAVAFASLGNEAHLYSGLGNHSLTRLAATDLQEHGVTLHDLASWGDEVPIISSILIDASCGERCVIYTDPGRYRLVSQNSWDQLLDGCSVLLLDGFYLELALSLAQTARDKSIPTVLDGGSWKKGLERLLPFIDFAICSADFMAPGCSDLTSTLSYLADMGISHNAVSRGSEPIVVYSDEKTYLLEVEPVDAADTLGAGDILHGAFCHHIVSESFIRSLELASRIASLSCCHFGTRDWIVHLHNQ